VREILAGDDLKEQIQKQDIIKIGEHDAPEKAKKQGLS